jgi:hypothetical protein
MITNVKEIYKDFNLARKHFKKAIELAKKNLIVGEINFPKGEKKIVKERLKKLAKVTPEAEGKDLPDGDAGNKFYK